MTQLSRLQKRVNQKPTTSFIQMVGFCLLFSPFSTQAQAPVEDISTAPAARSKAQPSIQSEMFSQLQQMQQELMQLRGIVEEQSYEIKQLKQQSLDRYIDLDRRLSGGSSTASNIGSTAAIPLTRSTTAANTQQRPAATSTAQPSSEASGASAYKAAYSKVKTQQFPQAVVAFKRFIQNYPQSRYVGNAHYWLGELHLVTEPQDLDAAKGSFKTLVENYPTHSKMPDALYKLAKVYFLTGDKQQSSQLLDRVVAEYSSKGSSAVKLAQQFKRDNF